MGSPNVLVTKNVILMCAAVARISATPKGAPEEACGDMIPKHGDAKPQTTDSPYNVKVSATSIRPGDTVDVTISGSKFKGFLLQARDSDSTSRDSEGKLVGKFSEGVEGSKYLKCDGMDRATVTHTSRDDKETITFKWMAPSEATGKKVKMFATVVQEKTKFWVKLEADEITVDRGSSVTTTSKPVSTTTKPNQTYDCPVILIYGESRMKRANMLMFPTEWKACKREKGESGCLYTRLPNTGKLEGNGVSYCISIGTPSQDSTCCVPKVSEPDYPGAMCNVIYNIPLSWDEFTSKIVAQIDLWNEDTSCPGRCEERNTMNPQKGPPLEPVLLKGTGEECTECPCGQQCLYKSNGTITDGGMQTIHASHFTPVMRYKDDLSFRHTRKTKNGSIEVLGHSRSSGPAYYDFTTNYCNLRNLITGSGLANLDGYSEKSDTSECMQYDKIEEFGNCNKY